jgi:hypothetical protein
VGPALAISEERRKENKTRIQAMRESEADELESSPGGGIFAFPDLPAACTLRALDSLAVIG